MIAKKPMDADNLEAVRARFKEMLEKGQPKAAGPTLKSQVVGMADEIRALLNKGYGYGDIVAVIKEKGSVEMSAGTLRNYVPRDEKKRKHAKPAASARKPRAEKPRPAKKEKDPREVLRVTESGTGDAGNGEFEVSTEGF
ncbi:MAG: hypothetical protein K6F46_06140 [Desulfovibrio sp.]|nr:hypothetical protein [Desulfovibrio sp.]